MKALIILVTVFHLCEGTALRRRSSIDVECNIQLRKKLSHDLYYHLSSFYWNRAQNDKEKIEKARKDALKRRKKEKEIPEEERSKMRYFAVFCTAYYNVLKYWLASLESPNYERNFAYFLPTVTHTLLEGDPKNFISAYAKFFDEFSHRFINHHLKDPIFRDLLGKDIISLRLQKEIPKILDENKDIKWDNYIDFINTRLNEMMQSFMLKYGIQDPQLEVKTNEDTNCAN